ncbi:unnamed protein product [Rhodiola kirilowii]
MNPISFFLCCSFVVQIPTPLNFPSFSKFLNSSQNPLTPTLYKPQKLPLFALPRPPHSMAQSTDLIHNANLKLQTSIADGHSSLSPNSSQFDNLYYTFVGQKRCSGGNGVMKLSLGTRNLSTFRRMWSEFNKAISFHCDKLPLGFASLNVGSEGLIGDRDGVVEKEGSDLKALNGEKCKKVLILMSDTGGGHRASAESIKAAFYEQYGDQYQVFVTDLWSEHTPWPFNQLPRSYNFLVKYGTLENDLLWDCSETSPSNKFRSNFNFYRSRGCERADEISA